MTASIPVLPESIVPDFSYGITRRFAEGALSQTFSLALDAYNTVKAGISSLNGIDIVPVAFDSAVFDFTRPALPTLPSFPDAPSYSSLVPPTLVVLPLNTGRAGVGADGGMGGAAGSLRGQCRTSMPARAPLAWAAAQAFANAVQV